MGLVNLANFTANLRREGLVMHPFDVAILVVAFCICFYVLYWLTTLILNMINLEASVRRHGVKKDQTE